IYSMTFDEYKNFPDPFLRREFSVREVEVRIQRYPNPEKPEELFQWDIHGRLLEPIKAAISGIAVIMIHGGAVNEYEFIFTPDGPEKYLDLTRVPSTESRVGVAQHMASLGISGAGGVAPRTLQPKPLATHPGTKTGVRYRRHSRR